MQGKRDAGTFERRLAKVIALFSQTKWRRWVKKEQLVTLIGGGGHQDEDGLGKAGA